MLESSAQTLISFRDCTLDCGEIPLWREDWWIDVRTAGKDLQEKPPTSSWKPMFLKKVLSHDHLFHKKLLGGTLAIIGKVVTLLDQPSAVEKLELNLPFQFLHRPVCKTLPEAQQTRTIKSETWLISATNTTLCTFLSPTPYLSTTIYNLYCCQHDNQH